MTLEELGQKRLKWVEANRENGFDDGIRRLLTELYPDNAHFIYELLQNAEDAQATEVHFMLKEDGVEFEHNGNRLFSIEDVDSITNIGDSPKRDDPTNIGKFGIGFKAVFAYTSTPEITSGKYHFRIRDLVVPDTNGLTSRTLGEKETRFSFPFDNPAKPPEEAQGEIESNLRRLDESTLLFLSSIRKIEYLLPDSTLGFLERKEADGNRIEILVQHPEESEPASTVFLRFEKTVEVKNENDNLQPCRIAVAFGLEENQEQEGKQPANRRRRTPPAQWKIKSLEPGKVCIYFPAEKETSNLRFHLHAPFASTVARDSVRDCPANDELWDNLADLIAESMTAVRDKGLLTVGFLATLPNDRDNLAFPYRLIQTRLVEVFQNEALTPMKLGGYAPANDAYRGGRQFSDLINDKDLAIILGKDRSEPLWIANPPQQNQREDNFLSLLGIREWRIEDFVDRLSDESVTITKWLAEKSDEWHQKLYALLLAFLDALSQPVATRTKNKLSKLRIIRCGDGIYRAGSESYFPSDGVERDENFPRVAKGVCSSGKNVQEQGKARRLLEDIGVREVGEVERVETILKRRYSKGSIKPREQDMKRFVALVEKEPAQAGLFSEYYIFHLANEKWGKPRRVFLDSPYLETGLSAYHEALGDDAGRKVTLSLKYRESGIEVERLIAFAKKVGVQTKLEPEQQPIPWDHRERDKLRDNGNKSFNRIDEDYDIPKLDVLLAKSNLSKSKLVWGTMNKSPEKCLYARYRSNASQEIKSASSTLVWKLKTHNWVPQKQDTEEKLLFVKPSDAAVELLPRGFQFDSGAKWLEAIEFGRNQQQKTEDYQHQEDAAKTTGFSSLEEAQEAKEVLELKRQDPAGFRKWKDSNRQKARFPTSPASNPERRRERLAGQYDAAPEKKYETLERSIRTTGSEGDHYTYLQNQYTNEAEQMICQICEKEMPFRKRDGEYYFEAVEVLSREYLPKEHEAQFLALCPVCAARYKEFVKSDEDAMKKLCDDLKSSDRFEVPLKLDDPASLRFVGTHWQDIKMILQKSAQSEMGIPDHQDAWTEQDQGDLTMASMQYAETRYPEEEIV